MATSLLTTFTYIDEPLIIASGDVIFVENLIHMHSVQTPDGNLSYKRQPSVNIYLQSGTISYLNRDPAILDSGILLDLGGNSANMLWLDA